MNFKFSFVLVLLAASAVSAQVASHAPTGAPNLANATANRSAAGKPVARVNGAVLTERDLVRELYIIFPYAKLHNGMPKSMEPQMRKGALDMIVFEELVYQEALRRKMTVSPERMKRAEIVFRKQFPTQQEYDAVLMAEVNGSLPKLREKIKRSLLIDDLLKSEVAEKAKVNVAEARTYYLKHAEEFKHPESFSIQTISIIPPQDGGLEVQKEARKKAEDALRLAQATKSYREFGLLAEKTSDDDWHVNMGDRKVVDRAKLPPEIVKAALGMKPGQVSNLIQLGTSYTLFRLNAHLPAGKTSFEQVRKQLLTDLPKRKTDQLRADLSRKLKQNAKIEIL